jgi:hypothetical protein
MPKLPKIGKIAKTKMPKLLGKIRIKPHMASSRRKLKPFWRRCSSGFMAVALKVRLPLSIN